MGLPGSDYREVRPGAGSVWGQSVLAVPDRSCLGMIAPGEGDSPGTPHPRIPPIRLRNRIRTRTKKECSLESATADALDLSNHVLSASVWFLLRPILAAIVLMLMMLEGWKNTALLRFLRLGGWRFSGTPVVQQFPPIHAHRPAKFAHPT